jgi:hypothetical protein
VDGRASEAALGDDDRERPEDALGVVVGLEAFRAEARRPGG